MIDIPNYTLIKRLGEGAMAEVWLAEHKRNGRKSAIKILRASRTQDGLDHEKLFLQEGRALASFHDRNIVTIYDNDRVGEVAFLAMEYLPGGTLYERMQRGNISVAESMGHVVQIASALGAMHAQGFLHRDLKPANILLRDETTPVLTDFGAVRTLGASTVFGKAGLVVGTPGYMSPEQMMGGEIDGRADLYALGVIFFELLTGKRPYNGTDREVVMQHFHAPLPLLPTDLVSLQRVIDQLLAKEPTERFADAAALTDALRDCFVADATLRKVIGFSINAAWSSQLRALGFALAPEQKRQIRIDQGQYLSETEPTCSDGDVTPRSSDPISRSDAEELVDKPPKEREMTLAPAAWRRSQGKHLLAERASFPEQMEWMLITGFLALWFAVTTFMNRDGELIITSDFGCELSINGDEVAVLRSGQPFSYSRKSGKYILRCRALNNRDRIVEQIVELKAGDEVKVAMSRQAIIGG